jgi:hypothetical protein
MGKHADALLPGMQLAMARLFRHKRVLYNVEVLTIRTEDSFGSHRAGTASYSCTHA